MEKIILFGTGQMFDPLLNIIEKVGEYEIEVVWDNNVDKQGRILDVLGKSIMIERPQRDFSECMIVITSTIYEEDMRRQLLVDLHIPESRIQSWNYCLKPIKKQIVEKYVNSADEEIIDILEYLKTNELDVFNNMNLKQKYDLKKTDFEVQRDPDCGLLYSWWKGKKIYLKRSFSSEKQVQSYLNGIKKEQDMESAHCYSQRRYKFLADDIIVDGGGAEGFFALENVENVKKIYIIEGEEEWVEALNYTFKPYREKVEIIPKWLAGAKCENSITLEELEEKDEITVLKLDIEGAERQVLEGAFSVLKKDKRMIALICVYHRSTDAQNIKEYMDSLGYKTNFSDGYLFFPFGEEINPELRRGLLFATKQIE